MSENLLERRPTSATLIPVKHELLLATRAKRTNVGWRRISPHVVFVLVDILIVSLAWQTASLLQGFWGRGELSGTTAAAVVPVVAVWVGMRALMGLYPGYGLDSVEELRRHTYSTFATLAALAISAVGFHVGGVLSRLMLGLTFMGLLVFAPLVRSSVKWGLKRMGLWGKPVMVLGYKETGSKVANVLRERWELGYRPMAIFNFSLAAPGGPFQVEDSEQALADVVDLGRSQRADTVIFAMPYTRREQLAKLVSLASVNFRHVLVIPNLDGVTNSAVVARSLGGTFAVEVRYNLLDPWALRAKRVMDLCATVIGGAFVLPLLLVLTVLVYLESGGPVFYTDRRMGQNNQLFSCVKFRTMVPDSEQLLWQILADNAELRKEYASYHKLREDPRVTRVGRFLRKTSLDELPQLWNVLKGEMSLVGPRPYLPRESEEIGVAQSELLRVPPGITGPWQVAGRSHASFDDRVRMDAYYVRDWSVWLDLVLLARTVRTVLFVRGAY